VQINDDDDDDDDDDYPIFIILANVACGVKAIERWIV